MVHCQNKEVIEMSIGLQSYPELYTTLLGLGLYDKLWELLSQTGIAYIPFVGMILRNLGHSYGAHGGHGAGPAALRTMEINLIVTILLILFAVVPCIPFDARTISYTPQCESNKDQTYPLNQPPLHKLNLSSYISNQ
jgi:hypothetical protein